MQCRPVRTLFDDNFNVRIADTIRKSIEPRQREYEQHAREEQEQQEKELQIALNAFPECHGKLHSTFDVLAANPYQTNDICYAMPPLQVIQWLSKNQVLAGLKFGYRDYQFIIDMPNPPATHDLPGAWVIGEEAAQYKDVEGAAQTAPRLRVLRWLD